MTRTRVAAAALAMGILSTLAPFGAQADENCETPIYLFTSYGQKTDIDDPTAPGKKLAPGNPSVVSSFVGCDVIVDDIPGTPNDDSNTDYIYPQANRMSARWLLPSKPLSGQIEFAGVTYELDMTCRELVPGSCEPYWDSQTIYYDQALSLTGGPAVVTFCAAEDECYSRTYRPVGT